jgi:hypothetical protein
MNSRLDALQAAVLRVKFRHFKDELKKRSENARKYSEFFNAVPGITPQKIANGNTSTYAQYTVLAEDRPAFLKKLESAGVPYCVHYPQPLHTQPCFKGLNQGLGNSNAIEACQKADGDRKITVASRIVGDEVFVTISNPVSGELLLKDGELQTTKKDERRHGFGLKNIKKAASGYGRDNVDYHVENGRFILRISLRFRDSLSA